MGFEPKILAMTTLPEWNKSDIRKEKLRWVRVTLA
jgi:hypothetical protein